MAYSPFSKTAVLKKKDNLWTVGTGIIYNEDGYIITKSSILADFEKIKVSLTNEKEYDATYIGTNEKIGLAILKIEATDLYPIQKGNSDDVALFSMVVVLGNSMGISPFASFGIINCYTKDGSFILSASINPGSSSSPVFNLNGEVIGLIAAQVDPSSWNSDYKYSSQQTGIVIPINEICQITDEIIRMEHEQKGWLGIVFNVDSLKNNKLSLSRVIPGSPADLSGLKSGDCLIKYNESFLKTDKVIGKLIEKTKPGTNVSINFLRDNRPLKVFARIQTKYPQSFNPRKPRHINSGMMKESKINPVQAPVILSPDEFKQINSRMIQMENEIHHLKSDIKNQK